MGRSILHLDMDAFFASVEQVRRPELAGRPVIVAGTAESRGVVATASYEARRYGVRSAMPTSQAKRLCPDGVFLIGDHRVYEEFSRRVFNLLGSFTPVVEPTSIDEAYLDVTGCEHLFGGPVALAREAKERIKAEMGLTCSVGIAPNRLLAKMASGMDKPDGLTVLTLDDVPVKLWPRAVAELHGVGPKTAAALRALGILTIGDLARYPSELAERHLGAAGRYLREAAQGLDRTPVPSDAHDSEAKSLSRETTFARDVSDRNELERTLLALCDQLSRRLRGEGLSGRTVTVRIRRSDFTTVSRSETLPQPSDLAEVFYDAATRCFDHYWRPGMAIRLLGVGASRLEKTGETAPGLFAPPAKLQRVSQAVDRIRNRYGERAVTRARLLRGEEPEP